MGEGAWGIDWLHQVLRRDLTPLETKIAEWAQRCYAGIYHLDGGNAWPRWMKEPSDLTHEISTIAPLGTRDGGSVWGNLATWVEVAHDIELRFALRPAGPYRIAVRFWHEAQP